MAQTPNAAEGAAAGADAMFMRRAIDLAARGWGRVHPNPLVGALVVSDGVIVGEGWHEVYGGPHAEVVALRAAGADARGATVYVSLEPCSHHGKTPPCTEALLAAGVSRVVFGAPDPHPDARGGGSTLRSAGVQVRGGVLADEVRRQNAAFFFAVERAAPFVVLKYALSLDARLSERAGEASAVTGEAARADVHRLRAGFDAILIGVGTALADDPLLTVRGDVVPRVPPARIVFDTEARLPSSSRLVASIADAPLWVVCSTSADVARRQVLESRGVRVIAVPAGEHGVDVDAALAALYRAGIQSVLCEGGGRMGSGLLAAARVEQLVLYYAPRVFGQNGTPAFEAANHDRWHVTECRLVGDDLRVDLVRRTLEY